MTDGGTAFQPGAEEVEAPLRSRGTYAGYRAFGSGDGAVLVEPEIARKLRSVAEFATQEGRIAGGLLYGRGWADEQGAYLVIDGYLEAGPGENRGDRISRDGTDRFTLSEADLRLLREDGVRMYSASVEAGWWRTLAALGEFGPQDFATQAELAGPDGVGLLVYGSGIHWGTAYLGPDGHAPDAAGTLVTVPEPASEPEPDLVPDPEAELEAGLVPEPEVVNIAAGESLAMEPPLGAAESSAPGTQAAPPRRRVRRGAAPRGTAPRVRTRRPAAASPGTAARRWAARRAAADGPPETPADVQFVIVALSIAVVAAAIIIGVLVSSVIVAVIIAAVGLLVIFSTIWMSRR
jgi:hypothetical protein